MIEVKPEPCQTCPYRKDVPSGVWSEEEYEKLRGYDEPDFLAASLDFFLCHQSTVAGCAIACKGWLTVQSDSIAVRLALARGELTLEDCAPPKVALHESGNAAADFGERDLKRPKRKALQVIRKLERTGKFVKGDDDGEHRR